MIDEDEIYTEECPLCSWSTHCNDPMKADENLDKHMKEKHSEVK